MPIDPVVHATALRSLDELQQQALSLREAFKVGSSPEHVQQAIVAITDTLAFHALMLQMLVRQTPQTPVTP